MQLLRIVIVLAYAFSCSLATEPAHANIGACVAFQDDPESHALNKACQLALVELKKAREALRKAEASAFSGGKAFVPAAAVTTAVAQSQRTPTAGEGLATDSAGETGSKPNKDQDEILEEGSREAKNLQATEKFGGLEFGVGIGFTYDLGNRDRIASADLVNGIIRPTQIGNVRARLLLESHYFFKPQSKFLGVEPGNWGLGPFVAIQGGSDKVIEGFGGGLMLGLKRVSLGANPTDEQIAAVSKDTSSFNIGFGAFYDFDVQTLGDGLLPNQPLPAGETAIRFTKRSQSGFLLLTSFSF